MRADVDWPRLGSVQPTQTAVDRSWRRASGKTSVSSGQNLRAGRAEILAFRSATGGMLPLLGRPHGRTSDRRDPRRASSAEIVTEPAMQGYSWKTSLSRQQVAGPRSGLTDPRATQVLRCPCSTSVFWRLRFPPVATLERIATLSSSSPRRSSAGSRQTGSACIGNRKSCHGKPGRAATTSSAGCKPANCIQRLSLGENPVGGGASSHPRTSY